MKLQATVPQPLDNPLKSYWNPKFGFATQINNLCSELPECTVQRQSLCGSQFSCVAYTVVSVSLHKQIQGSRNIPDTGVVTQILWLLSRNNTLKINKCVVCFQRYFRRR